MHINAWISPNVYLSGKNNQFNSVQRSRGNFLFFILLKHNIYNKLKSVLILVEIQYQLDEMRCMLVCKNNQNFKPKLYKINTTRMHEIR